MKIKRGELAEKQNSVVEEALDALGHNSVIVESFGGYVLKYLWGEKEYEITDTQDGKPHKVKITINMERTE